MARFLFWVEYLKIFWILGENMGIIIKILCGEGVGCLIIEVFLSYYFEEKNYWIFKN